MKKDFLNINKAYSFGSPAGSPEKDDHNLYEWDRNRFGGGRPEKRQRGYQVYNQTQLTQRTGRDKEGRLLSWTVGQPYFHISIAQRIELFKLSAPVFGLVTSRMNRIAGSTFSVVPDKVNEDRIVAQLKRMKDLFFEYSDNMNMTHLMVRGKSVIEIKRFLPDVLDDLSNFERALMRWRKETGFKIQDQAQEIMEWLEHPSRGVTWEMYVKKFVFDSMIHGMVGTYKDVPDGRILENFDTLAGGSVYKLKNPYVGGIDGHIQIIDGYEPQIFFGNEISVMNPFPISGIHSAMIPLEALINQLANLLLFNEYMAKQSDGTKPPEKLVVITNNLNPYDQPDSADELKMNTSEQKRIEEKLNTPRKHAIMTFAGNNATVVDLTKADTLPSQMQLQKDIRMDVATVFNASNIEMNLAGSEFTSGKENSQTQVEMEQGKGIIPIMAMIETQINRDILPYRHGGYSLEFSRGRNEIEELKADLLKLQTGEDTQNELRERKGKSVFEDDIYNQPMSAGQQVQPLGSEVNPMSMKQL